MNDFDARLTAALHADADSLPERDVMFRVDVLMRLERARFRRQVTLTMAVAVAAAAVAAMTAQAFEAWIAADVWHAWVVGVGAVAALFALPGMSIQALPGAGLLVRTIGRRLYP